MVTFPGGPQQPLDDEGGVSAIGKGIGTFIKGLFGIVLIAVGAFVVLVAGIAYLYSGLLLGIQWGQRIALAWGGM